MREKINRTTIIKTILVLYLILSAAYIAYDRWQAFQANIVQSSLMEGRRATIEELINQAQSSCQPFSVFLDEEEVQLINVECLQSPPEAGNEENAPPVP